MFRISFVPRQIPDEMTFNVVEENNSFFTFPTLKWFLRILTVSNHLKNTSCIQAMEVKFFWQYFIRGEYKIKQSLMCDLWLSDFLNQNQNKYIYFYGTCRNVKTFSIFYVSTFWYVWAIYNWNSLSKCSFINSQMLGKYFPFHATVKVRSRSTSRDVTIVTLREIWWMIEPQKD